MIAEMSLGRARALRVIRWRGLPARRDRVGGALSRRSGAVVDEVGIRARVERARSGDAGAFGELFESLRPDVVRLCRRLLASETESEDAASEVFLRARQALAGYDAAQPFRRWLLAIGAHLCIDRLRRRGTERRLFGPDELDPEGVAGPGPSPLQAVLDAQARERLTAAIQALPDRYRAPLVLRYFGDLDYDGIAGALDVTRGQVGTLLFRAKRRLREELGEKP